MTYDYTVLDPTAGQGDTIVNTDSPEFAKARDYVLRILGIQTYMITPYVTKTPAAKDGNIVPGEFSTVVGATLDLELGGRRIGLDCYLLFSKPEDAAKEACGALGVTIPSPFPSFVDETPDAEDPIGDPWPAHGAIIYHVSAAFSPSKWPVGSTYTGRLLNHTITWQRIVVCEGGPGGLLGGGGWDPAWRQIG